MNGQPVTVSTATHITLSQWVPTLLRWYPLRHGVVVGASQQAIQLLNAKPEKLTLFKANTSQTKPHPPEANVFDWVIADQNCPTSYYQASLACESGLQDPQMLKTCWPNIQCVSQQEVVARTLDTALQAIKPTLAANWLWVGSLPAATVLIGATQMLQQADVVAVRVTTSAGAPVNAGIQTVQTLMAQQGFELCGIQPERNPRVGTALFVKDHAAAQAQKMLLLSAQLQEAKQKTQELVQAKDLEAQSNKEAHSRIKELQQKQAELEYTHTQQLAHLMSEIHAEQEQVARLKQANDGEEQAKKQALNQMQLLANQHAQQKQVNDQQLAQLKSFQHQLAALTHVKDAEIQAKQQALTQIQTLHQQQAEEQHAHVNQLAQLSAKLLDEAQARQAEIIIRTRLQSEWDSVQQKNDALSAQQALIEAQLLKAEAQIAVINEIVWTQPAKPLLQSMAQSGLSMLPEQSISFGVEKLDLSQHAHHKCLLERAYTQWQFGDWHSLIKLTEEDLQDHPECAKLSLLASTGHHQLGDSVKAGQFIRMAQGWGCEPQLIAQFLMSGTYNSLASAAALLGQEEPSKKYFEKVWVTVSSDVDPLIQQARQLHQLNQIGLAKPN